MLYAYLGERKILVPKARALESTLRARQPEAAYFVLEDEQLTREIIDELSHSQGLFSKRYIVRLNGVCTESEGKSVLKEALPTLAQSKNIFILVEESLEAALEKAIEKHAEKVVYEKPKTTKSAKGKRGASDGFNPFSLGDALIERDRKKLWALLVESSMRGKPPEEIHGVISWQMRQVLSALAAGSAEEAGMKPYTYSKAKAALKKYSREELQGIADSLLKMNHDARRGITNLPAALEHLALTI